MRKVMVVTICFLLAAPAIGRAAPANNDIATAAAIASLPFDGSVDMSGATTQTGEVDQGCPGETLQEVPGYGSIWYRWTADRAVRVFGSFSAPAAVPAIDVYSSGTSLPGTLGLQGVACSTSGSGFEYDVGDLALVSFDAVAGRTYLFQVHAYGGTTTIYGDHLHIAEAPQVDVSIEDVTMVPTSATTFVAAAHVAWTGSFDPIAHLSYEACPSGLPDAACFVIGTEEVRLGSWADEWSDPWGSDFFVNKRWNTAGCAGDFIIKVEVTSPYAEDVDATNDRAAAAATLVGGGHGAGAGHCDLSQQTGIL